jgi:hypothetical protein
MAIFNSYVSHYQRVIPQFETPQKKNHLHHQGHLFLAETHVCCARFVALLGRFFIFEIQKSKPVRRMPAREVARKNFDLSSIGPDIF